MQLDEPIANTAIVFAESVIQIPKTRFSTGVLEFFGKHVDYSLRKVSQFGAIIIYRAYRAVCLSKVQLCF